jgi:Ni/Fe-hydrogenase subunit HybB-like protein
VHPFWHTPALPLLFLLSAFAVGYPMVILESIIAHRSLRLPIDRELLARLARFIPYTLGLYLLAKLADLGIRGELPGIFSRGSNTALFLAELLLGVITPIVIFASPKRRASVGWLLLGASLVVSGVAFNRLNVFLLAYSPLDPRATYMPSMSEILVTVGAIAMTVLAYRALVFHLPVIEHFAPQVASDQARAFAHHAPVLSSRARK